MFVGCAAQPRRAAGPSAGVLDVGPSPAYAPPAESAYAVDPAYAPDPLVTETPDAYAAVPAYDEPAGRAYAVRRGDTLWSIATRELGDGQRWRDIAAANPQVAATKLAVGQELVLPAF